LACVRGRVLLLVSLNLIQRDSSSSPCLRHSKIGKATGAEPSSLHHSGKSTASHIGKSKTRGLDHGMLTRQFQLATNLSLARMCASVCAWRKEGHTAFLSFWKCMCVFTSRQKDTHTHTHTHTVCAKNRFTTVNNDQRAPRGTPHTHTHTTMSIPTRANGSSFNVEMR
jgi:hypothetical protein